MIWPSRRDILSIAMTYTNLTHDAQLSVLSNVERSYKIVTISILVICHSNIVLLQWRTTTLQSCGCKRPNMVYRQGLKSNVVQFQLQSVKVNRAYVFYNVSTYHKRCRAAHGDYSQRETPPHWALFTFGRRHVIAPP